MEERALKILFGYPYFPSDAYENSEKSSLRYIKSLNDAGFLVEGFCLSLDPPSHALSFRELDRRWKAGDRALMHHYEALEKKLEDKDVLINGAGINLHPEFVENLKIFTVFQCFDDPENSHNLSKPVASSYNLCLVGNIAEVDSYLKWGAKKAIWTPMGLSPEIYDHRLTYTDIIEGRRDINLFMMIDKTSPWRKERMEKLEYFFPEAHFYGKGWSRGYLSSSVQLQYLKRAKIGPNIHNSTGPINYRTFYLPANGVMQICDNKEHLGKIFKLNKEVVGFNTIEECIDLCRYYLTHDEERRHIAAEGWKRCIRDYNQIAVFEKNIKAVSEMMSENSKKRDNRNISLISVHRSKIKYSKYIYRTLNLAVKMYHFLKKHTYVWLGRARSEKR